MSGTSELVKPLADAGVASNVIRILEEQRIDGADAINDLDANDWVRLYELGIKVGDKAAIQQVARKLREPTKFLVAPASLKFNLLAYAIGIVWAAPGVAIGAINTFGPFPADRELDTVGSSLLLVVLPGALYQVFATIVIESFRTYFSTDVLQQRSVGISLREAQRSNLANMAIVAALLLTVIIAMVQADSPLEGTGSNAALLAQYYMLFLVTSMVPLFGAIVMSSLLLLYIEPLDDSAAIAFIGPFMVPRSALRRASRRIRMRSMCHTRCAPAGRVPARPPLSSRAPARHARGRGRILAHE